MLLAGSQLVPGALGATAKPGNPPAAPSFRPLCVEPVAGRWQWDGCHHVILARAAMEPRVSLQPERCCWLAGDRARSG